MQDSVIAFRDLQHSKGGGWMPTHFIRRLECFALLSAEDRAEVESLCLAAQHTLRGREEIFRPGDRPSPVNVVIEGWACRYVTLEDGRRQITGVLVPGDVCDLNMQVLARHDHALGTVGPVRLAHVPWEQLAALMARRPAIERALACLALVDAATARAWLTNVGQRSAVERLAHLFCELYLRLAAVGLSRGRSCPFPLTQELLADATGLSSVHVNRSLMDLRGSGLVTLREKTLTITDFEALGRLALFDPAYLQLDASAAPGGPAHPPAAG